MLGVMDADELGDYLELRDQRVQRFIKRVNQVPGRQREISPPTTRRNRSGLRGEGQESTATQGRTDAFLLATTALFERLLSAS